MRRHRILSHLIGQRKLYPTAAKDGIVGAALAVCEIVAVHPVLVLEVADDGLDSGATAHLPFDLGRNRTFLLGRVDFELVVGWRIVAAVAGVVKTRLTPEDRLLIH